MMPETEKETHPASPKPSEQFMLGLVWFSLGVFTSLFWMEVAHALLKILQ